MTRLDLVILTGFRWVLPSVAFLVCGCQQSLKPAALRKPMEAAVPSRAPQSPEVSNRTAQFLGPAADRTSLVVELYAADFMNPSTFNAVISGSGAIEAQVIEYQIELRYRFQAAPEQLRGMIEEIVASDLLALQTDSTPARTEIHRDSRDEPLTIVLQNAAKERRTVRAAADHPPQAFVRCQLAIAAVSDPLKHKIAPTWSRGPYIGATPFPERR
jgi:hypothetical protein